MRWRKRASIAGVGFDCSGCGQHHTEMPLAFHSPAPVNWLLDEGLDRDPDSELGSDQCVIRGEEFYIRRASSGSWVGIAAAVRQPTIRWLQPSNTKAVKAIPDQVVT